MASGETIEHAPRPSKAGGGGLLSVLVSAAVVVGLTAVVIGAALAMLAIPTAFWSSAPGWTLITVGQIAIVVIGVLVALAFLLYADRKIWAAVQLRKGPNVVGPFGLLQ